MNTHTNFFTNPLLLLALFALLLSGCATPDGAMSGDDDDQVTDQQAQAAGGDGAISDGSGASVTAMVEDSLSARELLQQSDSPLSNRTIYFEFDSANLSDEALALLELHGNFVASNGDVRVRLEGHTDERGSREYNIALGDRRVQSVSRILLFQGAATDQMETVSYGEEKPAVSGHDEASWSKNRRVELIYEVK